MYIGKQSITFEKKPHILASGCVVGQKEGDGPLSDYFDEIIPDAMFGTSSWEAAESALQLSAANIALNKLNIKSNEIRCVFAGDLLGQLIATSFGISSLGIPLLGVYGACSTMGESLLLASSFISAGFADKAMAITSSHFASAEKTFRFPLGYGSQRKYSASWTVTGSGAIILGESGGFAQITCATPGKVIDFGLKDKENMGACMAPAAADTISTHLSDFSLNPNHYDKIITGDLGYVGQTILIDLLRKKGIDISKLHMDCGIEIYDRTRQDTHCGGSGCGCSAVTLCGYIFDKMKSGELSRILFVPTGALLSPCSANEGNSVPGIAHAVAIESLHK